MEITYNYLKNVVRREKEEIQNNPFVALIALTLITLPLPYKYNSISLILAVAFSLYQLRKKQFYFRKNLIVPVLLYGLMALSLLWTIDSRITTQALLKELSLVLIPFCFFLNPPLLEKETNKVMRYFSYSFFGYSLFYLIKAIIRYSITKDANVFFYHELVTVDVNAIHVSIYVSIAFFWFFLKKQKGMIDKIAIFTLLLLLFLLSSKNIIVIFILLLFASYFKASKMKFSKSRKGIALLTIAVIGVLFYGKIKERFSIEINSNQVAHSVNNEISNQDGLVYNVNIKDAWTKEKFQLNDYFPGTALRVYQIRIFIEMLQEDNSFFTGYGLNATHDKIDQKRIEHNLYPEYGKYNFHNQYIQIFAELGVVGFVLLLLLLSINLKNAIKTKHFVHFSFAVLMISLFLTESFLSRQRGIVFFTLLYCLFNSGIVKKDSIKK
jgi:O-antigen ligase